MVKILSVFIAYFLMVSVAAAQPTTHETVKRGGECKSCHQEKQRPLKYEFVKSWINSNHAAAGVTCVDCHLKKGLEGEDFYKAMVSDKKEDAHAYMVEEPGSRDMRSYFVDICGGCHAKRLDEFRASVHGEARLKTGRGVSCIDCHNPHRAPSVSHKDSKLYRGEDLNTCGGRCHREMLQTYMDTFHGKQFTLGNSLVPTCTYCHIGHELPTENPESAIHASSVGNLCAGCHGESMADGFGKDDMMIQNLSKASTGKVAHYRNPVSIGPFSIASIINSSYLLLVIGVVGFFTLLSTKDYIKQTKEESSHKGGSKGIKKTVKRFSLAWRMQHIFWAFSFIALAISGLSLKFPDSSLSQIIVNIMGGVAMRSSIHRIAALVFIVTAVVHIMPYILRFRSPKNVLLTKKDFIDALLHVSYLFDRTDKMPLMGRYAWYQKLEYWATVVGGCIVISTGILMWGFEPLIQKAPLALVHYSQMIHGWEAVLAVLVILVHHIYHTVLSPVVFPMDLSWITGRSKYAVMEHEHPLELMEIESAKEKGEHDR